MSILQIIFIVIIAAVACVVIKEYKPEYAIILQVITTVLVVIFVFDALSGLIKEASNIVDLTSINSDYFKLLIKALGISIIVKLASDTCNDCENEALASEIELAGKIIILSLSIPMIKDISELAFKLIKG